MRNRGNGLRHYVRLGKIREIESEFSRIGVRMARLWPKEVLGNLNLNFRFEKQVWSQKRKGGKNSRLAPCRQPCRQGCRQGCRQPCRQGCRHRVSALLVWVHQVWSWLSLGLCSRGFLNLRVLI